MNIVEALIKKPTKRNRDEIIEFIGSNPRRFEKLIDAFLSGPYRVTQRASWPLSYCVERHPQLIKVHLHLLVSYLGKPGHHDSVYRNILRLLQFVEIPGSLQGTVASHCFRFLTSPKEPVAFRVFAMSVLANIARDKPDLGKELVIILENQMPYGSPGFVSRARKILKELNG